MSRPTSLANWASVEFHLFSEYWRDQTESQCDEYRRTELSRPVSRVISLANWANYESLTLRLTSRISLILEYYWNLS